MILKIFLIVLLDRLDGSINFVENGGWYQETPLRCQTQFGSISENRFSNDNVGSAWSWTGSQSHSMVGYRPQRRRWRSTIASPHLRPLEGNYHFISTRLIGYLINHGCNRSLVSSSANVPIKTTWKTSRWNQRMVTCNETKHFKRMTRSKPIDWIKY